MCLFITATKKKAEQKRTGGGPAPPRYTPEEELEGIPGGSSSPDQKPRNSNSNAFIK